MPLLDDLALPLTDGELTRRKLLGLVGGGALSLALVGTGVTAIRYLEPNVLFEEDTRFAVGRPEDIATGNVLVLLAQKVFVVHAAEGFYALSSVCTHLGCMTRYQQERRGFDCPCHGSRFGVSGAVENGPAPHPLRRLELVLERGQLVVDTGKTASPDALLEVT